MKRLPKYGPWWLGLTGGLLLLGGWWGVGLLHPPSGPTLFNYLRVRAGMDRRDVQSLLGEPRYLVCASCYDEPRPDDPVSQWMYPGDHHWIAVSFDSHSQVEDKDLIFPGGTVLGRIQGIWRTWFR